MNKELKPCPFCGGEAETEGQINQTNQNLRVIVFCKECGAQMYRYGTIAVAESVEMNAIKAWNRRASDYDIDKVIKELIDNTQECTDRITYETHSFVPLFDAIKIVKGNCNG